MDAIAVPRATSGLAAVEAAIRLATDAGALAIERFRKPQDIGSKGRGNLVTETDLAVERLIRDRLRQQFPEHAILSEETAPEAATADWLWVVDPLDGTRNFVSGIPFFCVNIALCVDGEPVVAVTHDPTHGETFWAERGRGAWINDMPIHASTREFVRESVLGIDLGYDDERAAAMLRLAVDLFPGVQSLRIPGSAALGLAYASCGRYDLFLHNFLYPWDIASGILLVREAGGAISERDGRQVSLFSRTAVAGGRGVHDDFLGWERAHRPMRDGID